MEISYNKLWKLLIDRGMNKTDLKNATGISSSTISKMGKNESVSMDSMLKVCKALNCDIGDIVEFKNGETLEQEEEMEM
ncbi:helix-turn-helix domain-containing protein [Clostridium sp.]